MTNEILISWADQDFVTVSGTATVIAISTSARTNGTRSNVTDLASDEVKYTRWFDKSGTYKTRYVYARSLDGGVTDIAIDSAAGNNLFDGINQQAAADFNNIVETTKEIARGNHNISIFNEADGNSNDFRFPFQFIQFDLIDEHPVLGELRPAIENTGSMVLLGKYEAAVAEALHTFEFNKITFDEYSELVLVIDISVSAALTLLMRVNKDSSGNYTDGHRIATGAQTFIDINNAADVEICSSTILAAINRNPKIVVTIGLNKAGALDNIAGNTTVSSNQTLTAEWTGWIQVSNYSNLNTLQVSTSTSTWQTGTRMSLYGVKR